MIYEIDRNQILNLTIRQIDNLFVATDHDKMLLNEYFEQTLQRCEYCFSKTTNKYYSRQGEVYFNPYHSVQYMIYLYFFANTIYKAHLGHSNICDKLYYLNKSLNCIDLFYAVEMPDFFMAEHPVGSVIGKAIIGQGLLIYQNCTIGGFHLPGGDKVMYPTLGNNVKMFAGSSVIGDCNIGNNVNIGAGTIIKNQQVADNTNVFGQSPDLILKPLKLKYDE